MSGSKINGWVKALDWTLAGVALNREVVKSIMISHRMTRGWRVRPSPPVRLNEVQKCAIRHTRQLREEDAAPAPHETIRGSHHLRVELWPQQTNASAPAPRPPLPTGRATPSPVPLGGQGERRDRTILGFPAIQAVGERRGTYLVGGGVIQLRVIGPVTNIATCEYESSEGAVWAPTLPNIYKCRHTTRSGAFGSSNTVIHH